MSWLYSRALVEASSGGGCSDGAPSAPSSGNPTPQAYLPPDRMTAFSRPSRFGMTFAPLTDDHGAAVLTSYLAAFPARTSALQAKVLALTEPDQACGPTWRVSLARFSPATSSWKTAQRSLLGDSDECSVIWPRSGMTAGGQCWELPTLERRISGTGSGLLQETWPTPRCHMTRPVRVRMDVEKGHKSNLEEVVAVRAMWPTPRASETFQGYETLNALKDGNQSWMGSGRGATLTTAVMARNLWPTPTVCGNYNRKGASPTSGDGLATAVLKFPTPSTLGINGGSHSRAAAVKRGQAVTEVNGGSLNPTWVEWLMGWPLGWTDLKPLATDKFHSAQQLHGGF